MAPEEMQDLVQDFTAKATAVNAVVQELPNMAAALQYVVDVCENKAPCELMADEDVEKGPNGPNGVPTRVQRIVAAPVLNDEDFATLEAACNEKGFLCIRDGLRNHLAGIDVGLTAAEMGVSSSATCLVNTDNEDARLAGMISEIHVLLLAKSKLVRTLPEIADRMRELLMANPKGGNYTTLIRRYRARGRRGRSWPAGIAYHSSGGLSHEPHCTQKPFGLPQGY